MAKTRIQLTAYRLESTHVEMEFLAKTPEEKDEVREFGLAIGATSIEAIENGLKLTVPKPKSEEGEKIAFHTEEDGIPIPHSHTGWAGLDRDEGG